MRGVMIRIVTIKMSSVVGESDSEGGKDKSCD